VRAQLTALAFAFVACTFMLVGCRGGSPKSTTTPSNTVGASNASADTTTSGDGAGEARVVQRTQAGGVIELEGGRQAAMRQAQTEMESHCGPGNFTIVQEGEESIGNDTLAAAGNSQSTTRTATAWRVHYECNGN
jgi:hypothetical protein